MPIFSVHISPLYYCLIPVLVHVYLLGFFHMIPEGCDMHWEEKLRLLVSTAPTDTNFPTIIKAKEMDFPPQSLPLKSISFPFCMYFVFSFQWGRGKPWEWGVQVKKSSQGKETDDLYWMLLTSQVRWGPKPNIYWLCIEIKVSFCPPGTPNL